RIRFWRRLRQNQELLAGLQPLFEIGEIFPACCDETFQSGHLRQRARGLHVGYLEVVAQVRIRVLVVIAERKIAELPFETLATGVVLARRAIAVAPPIAETVRNLLEIEIVGEDRAPLAHGDVMRRVETQRADVAKGAYQASVVRGAKRVATILDQP